MDQGAFRDRLDSLRETRARLPELVRNRHATRRRRSVPGHTGHLVLIEADAPAAGLLAAGSDEQAMGDRGELLFRLCQALDVPGVDGVIATVDVIDDLLLLEQLEDRLVIGSMNRGGQSGSPFAFSGGFTGYDADAVAASHLDGGLLRLRIDPQGPDVEETLSAAGRAVTGLSGHGVLALIEPSWCAGDGGAPVVDTSLPALRRAVGVASALGARSPYTWLALPVVPDLPEVVAATTLPLLLRAGEATSAPGVEQDDWRAALALPGVRGIVLPTAALYPDHGEPLARVEAAAAVVREAAGVDAERRKGAGR